MRYELTAAGVVVVCEACGAKRPGGLSVRKIPGMPNLEHITHPDDWGVVVFRAPAILAPRPPGWQPRINPGMSAAQIAEVTGRPVQAFACARCLKQAQPIAAGEG